VETWAATGFENIAAAIAVVITSFRIGLVIGILVGVFFIVDVLQLRYRRDWKGRMAQTFARARRKRRRGKQTFIALRRCRATRTALNP